MSTATTEIKTNYVSLRYFIENFLNVNGQKFIPTQEDLVMIDLQELAEEMGVVPFWRYKRRLGGMETIVNPKVVEEYKRRKKSNQ